ncbi:hypothetical protein GS502_10770 [Rhodococcus hoagii]|nr:hypothetical protein [Prescottella equi]
MNTTTGHERRKMDRTEISKMVAEADPYNFDRAHPQAWSADSLEPWFFPPPGIPVVVSLYADGGQDLVYCGATDSLRERLVALSESGFQWSEWCAVAMPDLLTAYEVVQTMWDTTSSSTTLRPCCPVRPPIPAPSERNLRDAYRIRKNEEQIA